MKSRSGRRLSVVAVTLDGSPVALDNAWIEPGWLDPDERAKRRDRRGPRVRSSVMESKLPEELERLVADLQRIGFEVTRDECDPEVFGNSLVELSRSPRPAQHVRLVRDRGIWEVEVGIADDWHDPYQIVLALDGAKYSRRAMSHVKRRQLTLEAVERLTNDEGELGVVRRRLAAFRREYWRRFEAQAGPGESTAR
jgi:hypothetical protein